jgi:SAM-dependent methyltransferase
MPARHLRPHGTSHQWKSVLEDDVSELKPPTAKVEARARTEAGVWEGSPYYHDAERWTWLFWSDAHSFRPLFEQLDLSHVLELACGHGRHSEYLLAHYGLRLGSLVMMDILQSNVDYCKARLGQNGNLRVLVNNGIDFQPTPASSLTSIFCYDAMVHFDRRVVQSYLQDTARVLVPGGKALFHHSNYSFDPDCHFGTNPQARAFMSKGLFARYAERLGLEVLQQTVFDWGGEPGLDCLTLLAKSET